MRKNIPSFSFAENLLIRDCSHYSYGFQLSKTWDIITFCLDEIWSHKNLTNEVLKALHFSNDLTLVCSYFGDEIINVLNTLCTLTLLKSHKDKTFHLKSKTDISW